MITDTFDNKSEELLKAQDLPAHAGGACAVDFPETVIVTFSSKVIDLVRDQMGCEVISFMLTGEKIPVYQIELPEDIAATLNRNVANKSDMKVGRHDMGQAHHNKHRKLAIYQSGMGAPLAAALMEEVIAKGGKNFIVFGSCGVLSKDLAEGHVILPAEAYRDEGTSYHYAPASEYITIRNADRVAEIMTEIEVPFVKGRIWTTDGLYRETRNNTDARRSEGCIAVDMECSALQAVCSMRGAEFYQFVYGEDLLNDETWLPRNMGKVTHNEMQAHLRIAMEIAARI